MRGVRCNVGSGPSKARSCESYYTPVPGLLLLRPLWQCICSALAREIVPKVLKSISGCEEFPLSSHGFAQSTSMNPLCRQGHPTPAKAVTSWLPWKGWSCELQGCDGQGCVTHTLSGRDRCLSRVFIQPGKHTGCWCQGYGWRWLKLFVAFPCSSSALVIPVSDLFCLPGKTRCFCLPALQTQSGIWKITSFSFSFCVKMKSLLQKSINLKVCIIDFKTCHFCWVTFVTCRCFKQKISVLLNPNMNCAKFSSLCLSNKRNKADGDGTVLP